MPAQQHHHGLSLREQEIMDLADAGVSARTISARLSLNVAYVQQTIRLFDFSTVWSNSHRFERQVRAAERSYASALIASGGRYA